jgi:hypothetical protein
LFKLLIDVHHDLPEALSHSRAAGVEWCGWEYSGMRKIRLQTTTGSQLADDGTHNMMCCAFVHVLNKQQQLARFGNPSTAATFVHQAIREWIRDER